MAEGVPTDPLVDEIRAIRKELSDRFDNDVDKLCDYLKTIEETVKDRVVAPPSTRPMGVE